MRTSVLISDLAWVNNTQFVFHWGFLFWINCVVWADSGRSSFISESACTASPNCLVGLIKCRNYSPYADYLVSSAIVVFTITTNCFHYKTNCKKTRWLQKTDVHQVSDDYAFIISPFVHSIKLIRTSFVQQKLVRRRRGWGRYYRPPARHFAPLAELTKWFNVTAGWKLAACCYILLQVCASRYAITVTACLQPIKCCGSAA